MSGNGVSIVLVFWLAPSLLVFGGLLVKAWWPLHPRFYAKPGHRVY